MRNRNNTVTGPPILLPRDWAMFASRPGYKWDGYLLPPGPAFGSQQSVPVSVFTAQSLEDFWKRRPVFEKEYGSVGQRGEATLRAFQILLQLRRVPRTKSEGYIQWKAAEEMRSFQWIDYFGRDTSKELLRERFKQRTGNPLWEFVCELNTGLMKAQPVIWIPKADPRPSPGLLCREVQDALLTYLFFSQEAARAWALCLRCQTPFRRRKRKQNFCSLNCGAAARMARMRARRDKGRRQKRA